MIFEYKVRARHRLGWKEFKLYADTDIEEFFNRNSIDYVRNMTDTVEHRLLKEIDKLVDTNEDINREFSQYKYESKKEIERLKSRLEEYQEYVEINHKEIERLNNIIKEQGLEDKSNYYVKGLEGSLKEYQDEVKRLNNIINELEKGIKENIEELEEHQLSRDRIDEDKEILRFLQELKGSDKE